MKANDNLPKIPTPETHCFNESGDVLYEYCDATIEFGDDYGDNYCTFYCDLPKGHLMQHQESGVMCQGNMPYVLEWTGDQRVIDLEEDINHLENTLACDHEWNLNFDWCNKCAGQRYMLDGLPKRIESLKEELKAITGR